MTGFVPDHAGADVRVSPNFGPRREGRRPDVILLHYTGMETGEAAEAWLCSHESEVSSHYLVHEDGRIVQMVRESDRAWHAGKSSWLGDADINSRSIGIEIANPGHAFGYPAFPQAQIDAVIRLCRGIIGRHRIAPEHVLAHSDVAPGRKVDPGEQFPWTRLHEAGIGHLIEPSPIRNGPSLSIGDSGTGVEVLQSMLALYGYGIDINGIYGTQTRDVVEAFQRHFRPERIDGVADASTTHTLQRLLAALPENLT
jgi:N-acetylmuramoyl-L-alanine amidase